MHRLVTIACATALSLAAFSSCSNDPTLNNNTNTSGSNIQFQQVDRIGKPGIKELFLPFAQHDAYNRDVPANDLKNSAPKIATFVASVAGRSAAISSYVPALLLPDALIVNLTSAAPRASYLGYETNAALPVDCRGPAFAPANFGGRALTDDVVSTTLALAYGRIATTSAPNAGTGLAPAPDDFRERMGQGGTPQLSTDNVSCLTGTGGAPAKSTSLASFPYLNAPI